MFFSDFIAKNCVSIDTVSLSKTAVFLQLSHLLTQNHPHLLPENIFDIFWKRESLGSMAIGHGVAIPHVRTASIARTHGCFLKLKNPMDFGADDQQPVDLVLGFMVPQDQSLHHLKLLAAIAKKFNEPGFRDSCRTQTNESDLYHLMQFSPLTIAQEELALL